MRSIAAFLSSLFVPVVRLRLVLLLYLLHLAFSALIAGPLGAQIDDTLAHSWSGALLEEDYQEWAWQDLEATRSQGLGAVQSSSSWVILAYLLFSFALVSAGTFWVLASPERRSRPAEFLHGCGRLAMPFCRLLVLFVAGLVLLALVNGWLTRAVNWFLIDVQLRSADSTTLAVLLHGKTLVMLLAVGWLAAAMGLAKAAAALDGERSMLRASWRALGLSLRNPLGTPLLAATAPLLAAALLVGYAALRDRLPTEPLLIAQRYTLTPSLLLVALHQAFAFALQAVLVLWTAMFLKFYRSAIPAPAESTPPRERPLTVVDVPA